MCTRYLLRFVQDVSHNYLHSFVINFTLPRKRKKRLNAVSIHFECFTSIVNKNTYFAH